MANYPTPHIKAVPGDFGQTVLMPGDPLRSQFIAENFLENPILVNNVRGVQGYTGTYKGTRVSVMASGMGMPSIGIYSWELFTVFGVENILRIGSTGALQPQVNIRDIVVGQGACTDSAWATQYHLPGTFAPIADYTMLRTCVETAEQLGLPYHVGNLLSSDRFYGDDGDMPDGWKANNAWGEDGRSCGRDGGRGPLYERRPLRASAPSRSAPISDQLVRQEFTTSEERQTGFTQMMQLALETAIKLEK